MVGGGSMAVFHEIHILYTSTATIRRIATLQHRFGAISYKLWGYA
jgi:hypothetical protein